MGKQPAKVGDFTQIVTVLRAQQGALDELRPLRITELAMSEASHVAELAWQVIAAIPPPNGYEPTASGEFFASTFSGPRALTLVDLH